MSSLDSLFKRYEELSNLMCESEEAAFEYQEEWKKLDRQVEVFRDVFEKWSDQVTDHIKRSNFVK